MSEFSVGFCWENLLLLPNLLRFLCWFSLQPILSSFVFQTLETLGSNIFEGELVDVIVTSNQCRSDKGIKHYVLRNTQVTALPSGTSPDIWPRASQACREAHGAIERQLRLDVCQIGSCIFSLCMAELHRSQSFWSIPSISACKTGWWYTYPSEKYESVSWDDYSQYMEKSNSCSKPPTRYCMFIGSDPLHVFSWTILNPSRWHHNSWWLIMTLRHKLGYSPSQPNATNRGYIHRCNKKNAATSHFMFSATAIYFKVNKGFSQHCWYCKEATAEFDDPPLDCPKSSNFLWNIIFIFQKKYQVGGIPTPLKDMSQMGRILPNWTESHKIHVPDHQPGIYVCPQVIKHGNRKIHPFRHVFPSETSKSLGDSPAPPGLAMRAPAVFWDFWSEIWGHKPRPSY